MKPAIYSAGQFPNCNDFSASTMSAFTVAVRRWGRAQVVAPRGAEMRKIIIGATTSLDGVMQGPGGPHEDPIGGFRYGGWVAPFDAVVINPVAIGLWYRAAGRPRRAWRKTSPVTVS